MEKQTKKQWGGKKKNQNQAVSLSHDLITLNRMDAEDGQITPTPPWAPRTSAESGRIRWLHVCYKQPGTNAAVSLSQIR